MAPDNLRRGITLEALGTGVPGSHVARWIEHEDGVVAGILEDKAKALLAEAQSFLHFLSESDVAHDCQDETSLLRVHGTEHDVDRKLSPVLTETQEFEAGSHRSQARF